MNVANKKLCQELYEVSGWHKTDYYYSDKQNKSVHILAASVTDCPAYDLGYLLRKLPKTIDLGKPKVRDLYVVAGSDCWIADYKYRVPTQQQEWMHMYDKAKLTEADTPENAACKLAIELFKQNILTKEQ